MEDHFPIEELILSRLASTLGLSNFPTAGALHNINTFLKPGLELCRAQLGDRVMPVSSGYRSPEVNCMANGAMTVTSLNKLLRDTSSAEVRAYASTRLRMQRYGPSDSKHMGGLAADVTCRGFGSVYDVCRSIQDSGIVFDQLIWEYEAWMHIQFGGLNRQEVMTIKSGWSGYRAGLVI